MSTRILIGPNENLIETIVDNLRMDGRNFSDRAIVFPGKRPAHFLRKELAQRIGGSFIPPCILSVDDFVLTLFRQLHPEATNDLEPIDAITLLYQIHSELKERLGGDYFSSLDTFVPIGLKLFDELEELRLANLPERRLKETLSSLTYNRLFSLAEYYTRFYKLTKEKAYITRSIRYSEVAEHIQRIELSEYTQIIVAGLFKLTHAEQIIFDELEKRPNTLFVFQTDKVENGIPEPEIRFYKASDTHGQVFALSAIIQKRLKIGVSLDERSVIVLPTADALFPVLHQTLSLLPKDEFNIALGYPITRTPIYGFLHSLMELICSKQGERYSAVQYIKFILHPYTKNIRFERRTDVTRILFHALESFLTRDKSKILVTLKELEQADEVFTNVASSFAESGIETTPEQIKEHLQTIHTHTIYMLEEITSLKEFAHKVIEVLTYIYENSTAQLHPLFRPYAEAILQVFLHIEQSLIGNASFQDATGYFNLIQQYLVKQEVHFSGTPLRGLQVLGLLETRGLRFNDVYLLNVNDDVLPGGVGSDMLLPQQLREKLGLETRHDRDKLSEYYFNLLVRGAKRVHLFFSESGENDKSRFIEKLLWERQKRDGTYTSDRYVQTVHYRVRLANENVEPIPKLADVLEVLHGFTYSASALDTYLQCPIRFYYQYVLRLKEKEEVSADLDSQDIGIFIHEVLKKYYEPFIGKNLKVHDLIPEQIEQVVEKSFSQKFGAESVGAMYLLKRQIQRQLKALLNDYQKPVLETNDIVLKNLEQKITISAFGYKFEGKLDRVEQRGASDVILDYKTGVKIKKPPINFSKLDLEQRESWSGAIYSLQLPMYLLLYQMHTGMDIRHIIPAYLFIGESYLSKDSEYVFMEDMEEREAGFAQTQKLIELILREINNITVPFFPAMDLNKTCPRCPYSTLCGTSWVRGWNSK